MIATQEIPRSSSWVKKPIVFSSSRGGEIEVGEFVWVVWPINLSELIPCIFALKTESPKQARKIDRMSTSTHPCIKPAAPIWEIQGIALPGPWRKSEVCHKFENRPADACGSCRRPGSITAAAVVEEAAVSVATPRARESRSSTWYPRARWRLQRPGWDNTKMRSRRRRKPPVCN